GLVVRLELLRTGPVPDRVPNRVHEVGADPAALDLEHLVPATRPVETERWAGGRGRDRILHLVAVVELLDRRLERLERRLGDPADPAQRVQNLVVLGRGLRVVGEILETATAAGGVVGAGSVDTLRTGL